MKARWGYHSRDRDSVLKHHLWRLLLLGATSTVKGWWRIKEKKIENIVDVALWCLRTCRLMGRLDWVEVIFVSKMCEAKVERREAECGFRKIPVFIARGFLSRKRRNKSLYEILKFYKYLLIPKYSSESTTELVTGAHWSLGEGDWFACIDFLGRDESDGDIAKDFGKETKIFQLAVLPAWQSQGKAWRLEYWEMLLRKPESRFGGNFSAPFVSELHPSAES